MEGHHYGVPLSTHMGVYNSFIQTFMCTASGGPLGQLSLILSPCFHVKPSYIPAAELSLALNQQEVDGGPRWWLVVMAARVTPQPPRAGCGNGDRKGQASRRAQA